MELETWDHKIYYPGPHALHIGIPGDRETRRLLGAQIVGHRDAEVTKRIDVFATALFHGMKIDALNELALSYTPPLSSPVGSGTDERSGVDAGARAWAYVGPLRLWGSAQP